MTEVIKPVVYNKYSPLVWKEVLDDARIKHKDYFNVKYLYMMCHEWMIEHLYGTRKDEKWPETMYMHRFTQNSGQEVWIWWRFRKVFNRFIRYDLDVDWHIIGMEEAEIVKDGKKYKCEKGECEFKIYAKLIFDPGLDFKKGILGSLKETFWQRMYYKDILAHRKQLYHELYEFKQFIKTYFNLRNFLPEPEGHKFWHDENENTPFLEPGEKK